VFGGRRGPSEAPRDRPSTAPVRVHSNIQTTQSRSGECLPNGEYSFHIPIVYTSTNRFPRGPIGLRSANPSEAQRRLTTGVVLRGTESLLTHRCRKPDSNFSSLSGSVPLRARGTIGGNHMARLREFLRGWPNSSNPSPSSGESATNCTGGGLRWSPAAIHAPHWNAERAPSPAARRQRVGRQVH
jgi:hypothetical protein